MVARERSAVNGAGRSWHAAAIAGGIVVVACLSTFDLAGASRVRCELPSNRVLRLAELDALWVNTLFQLESVRAGKRSSDARTPIALRRGDALELRGWAVDFEQDRPAAAVFVVLDGRQTYLASYGGSRPDVAATTHDERFRYSGFSAVIPASALTPGKHVARFKIVAGDLSGYYDPQRDVQIAVRVSAAGNLPAAHSSRRR